MKLRSGNIKDLPQSLARMQTISRPPYLPTEVWIMIGNEIRDRPTLHSLILTCHALRDIFRPILHSYKILELSCHKPVDLKEILIRPTIACTKSLEVVVKEWCHGHTYNYKLNNAFVSYLVKLIDRMPHLQSFRWLDDSYEHGKRPSEMMQNYNLLAALKRCKNLRFLSVSLQDPYIDNAFGSEWEADYTIQLKGFRNLTSLELYNIWTPPQNQQRLDRLCRNLVETFIDNPQLRKLGLAMAAEQEHLNYPPVMASQNVQFLETLCRFYQHKPDSTPLELHTLLLGFQTFGYNYDTVSGTDFLKHLVQADKLRTLHIYNSLITERLEDDDDNFLELDWVGFSNCKSLRQVSLSRLGADARKWLNSVGTSIEELIITDHYSRYDQELNNFGGLELPNLSMLLTQEISAKNRPDDGASSFGEFLEENGDETLNGPRVHIDRALITVLDRLPDGGRKFTCLALSFDFQVQWERFTTHLPHLTQLTYLRISSRSHLSGNYPPKAASLWSDAQRPHEIGSRYAKLAKVLCPSLKYIMIGYHAWEVEIPERLATEKDIFTKVQLRKLGNHEVHSIELFALERFTMQSGLPGIDPPHRPASEKHDEYCEVIGRILEVAGDDIDLIQQLMEAHHAGQEI